MKKKEQIYLLNQMELLRADAEKLTTEEMLDKCVNLIKVTKLNAFGFVQNQIGGDNSNQSQIMNISLH